MCSMDKMTDRELQDLAETLDDNKHHADAEAVWNRLLDGSFRLHASREVYCLKRLSACLTMQNKHTEAEAAATRALETCEKIFDARKREDFQSMALEQLGGCLIQQKRFDDAAVSV